VTKYDDASWHYGGDFPKGLASEAGATHIAMFFAWALDVGLGGNLHIRECPEDLVMLKERRLSPATLFLRVADGKMTSEDFNDEGNAFATAYYAPLKLYVSDYEEVLGKGLSSLYHAEDTWANFERFKIRIDQRFAEWKLGKLPSLS
jgi:hypothetical protein